MSIVRFNWPWYLPPRAKRVIALAVILVVVIVAAAFTTGYGEAAFATLGVAVLSAVATEGVKAGLRARPYNA